MEKRLASGKHMTKQGVFVIAPLQHRMAQKGQQVEAEHQRRQILLAMPKVVLQMVPLGLEHVIVFRLQSSSAHDPLAQPPQCYQLSSDDW